MDVTAALLALGWYGLLIGAVVVLLVVLIQIAIISAGVRRGVRAGLQDFFGKDAGQVRVLGEADIPVIANGVYQALGLRDQQRGQQPPNI